MVRVIEDARRETYTIPRDLDGYLSQEWPATGVTSTLEMQNTLSSACAKDPASLNCPTIIADLNAFAASQGSGTTPSYEDPELVRARQDLTEAQNYRQELDDLMM